MLTATLRDIWTPSKHALVQIVRDPNLFRDVLAMHFGHAYRMVSASTCRCIKGGVLVPLVQVMLLYIRTNQGTRVYVRVRVHVNMYEHAHTCALDGIRDKRHACTHDQA